MPIRIAIVGFGKIARDQHVPSIAADPRFALAAVASRSGDPGIDVPWFASPAELFASFDQRPLASASIGQVHAAQLPDGVAATVERALVKVPRMLGGAPTRATSIA